MDKTLNISGIDVKFRATARTPRLYRAIIGRDLIRDINQLRKAYNKAVSIGEDATDEEKQDAQLSVMDLELFENIAYIMARHANPEISVPVDEWLDSFDMFSIWQILPELLKLWALNEQTTSTPKKNRTQRPGTERGDIYAQMCGVTSIK